MGVEHRDYARFNGAPTGTLPSGTTQAALSLPADENTTCRYDTSAGASFDLMTEHFTTSDGSALSTYVAIPINGSIITIT